MTPEPRVCLLLGAGGRLGRSFCRYFSSRYLIAAVYRSHMPQIERYYEQVIDPLHPDLAVREQHSAFYPIHADLGDTGSPKRIVDLALAAFGRVDLVVNAAVHYDWGSALSSDFLERLQQQFLINVIRPLELTSALYQSAWRTSAEDNIRHNRNVINISSVSSFNIYQGGQVGYSSSKAALNIASRHLAAELAQVGVRVNVLAPNAFPRIISYEQVLAALYELDADSTTGEVRVVDRDL